MKLSLAILWYIASILIIYSGIKYSIKYKFIQLNIKKIINALKSKSNSNISPLSSLCISLAAKIGVGSLSGIALAIYFGGIGTIFWIVIISLIIMVNTYVECILGIKYRRKLKNNFMGGPSYYILKCLKNRPLSYLYSVIIIIVYGILFTSIQTTTIVNTTSYLGINSNYVVILLLLIIFYIISKGIKGISKVNTIIVPIMLIIYFILGIVLLIKNINIFPNIVLSIIKEALNPRSIISTFLIGMQRAIFVTESSIGTSAISASICDNNPEKQAMLEIFGIYITVFIISLTTFIIIITSDYQLVNFKSINGIDLVLYAFKYHFNNLGVIYLSIITILFAFSTIVSSYYFGESNLTFITNKKIAKIIYKIIYLLLVIISSSFKVLSLWNLTDYLLALLAIINIYSILKINK